MRFPALPETAVSAGTMFVAPSPRNRRSVGIYPVPMASASPWILLARLLRPQGRKGEILADLFTSNPSLFKDKPQVWLAPAGFTVAASPSAIEPRPIEVRDFWLPVGRNAGRVVLHLAGIDTITQAEALAGSEIVIPAADRPQLESGTVYTADLIGATVFDREQPIGTIADVQFPTSPDGSRRLDDAAPLLAVHTPAGDELLIPFANQYIREMDLRHARLRMELPEGLLDLNRTTTPDKPSPKESD